MHGRHCGSLEATLGLVETNLYLRDQLCSIAFYRLECWNLEVYNVRSDVSCTIHIDPLGGLHETSPKAE